MAAETPPQNKSIEWPSALVASAIILLVGSITLTAIIKYPTTEEALKIWAALAGIVGLLTGAFVTYFFTRAATVEAQEKAKTAEDRAKEVQAQANKCNQETKNLYRTFIRAAPLFTQEQWKAFREDNPFLPDDLRPDVWH